MTDTTKPALTPEEWAALAPQFAMPFVYGIIFGRGKTDGEYRHAHAAIALHGQPFGFTRQTLRCLYVCLASSPRDEQAEFAAHIARIEALLPPESP